MKISTPPIIGEIELEDLKEKLKDLGQMCHILKNFYPSSWAAIKNQYMPEYSSERRRVISDGLFDKKLEIMLEQDEERRTKG